MIKTKEDVEKELELLHKKHPNLYDVSVKFADEYPEDHYVHNYKWMADFIDKAWSHTYTNPDGTKKSRFIYTPDYLEWLLGGDFIDKGLTQFLKNKKGETICFHYGFNRKLAINKKNFKITMNSGLSVLPKYRGQGLAQYLFLKFQERVINKYHSSCFWFDARNTKKGHSLEFSKRKYSSFRISYGILYTKIFNPKKAFQVNYFNLIQKIALKTISGIPSFTQGKLKTRLGSKEYIDDIVKFIDNAYAPDIGHFIFNHKEVERIMFYSSAQLKTTVTILTDKEKIKGLLYGYTIPVEEKGRGTAFFIDNIITKDISLSEKKRFVKNSLNLIAENNDVYCAIVVDNTCDLTGLKNSVFIPAFSASLIPKIQKLARGFVNYNREIYENTQNLDKIYVEHK